MSNLDTGAHIKNAHHIEENTEATYIESVAKEVYNVRVLACLSIADIYFFLLSKQTKQRYDGQNYFCIFALQISQTLAIFLKLLQTKV